MLTDEIIVLGPEVYKKKKKKKTRKIKQYIDILIRDYFSM